MLSASPLVWIIVVFLAAAAVVLALLLSVRKHRDTGRSREGAREILQQRYADGEISRDEYLQILNDLSYRNLRSQLKRKIAMSSSG